ncbi:MAG: RNA methyltransferase [Cyclobacteriaceae bacterium]|nr:RNA methyltransferase [Cyclobacteriaceae bacterium]
MVICNDLMEEITNMLSEFVTENKKTQIEKVLDERTRHLSVVLEDIYQPQNASAIVRTCDCFGIQDLHIIEKENQYSINPKVVMGASKWVDLYSYCIPDINNTISCVTNLKQKGYRIVATTPDANCKPINELNLNEKVALVFGTEQTGVSNELLQMADEKVTIPMYGFTESFNISVSAAVSLYTITEKLRQSSICWKLSKEEKNELRLDWYKKIVKRSDLIIEEYIQQKAK